MISTRQNILHNKVETNKPVSGDSSLHTNEF